MSKSQALCVVEAACMIVYYDLVHKKVVGKNGLKCWLEKVETSVMYSSANSVRTNNQKGSTSYTDRTMAEHPQYLPTISTQNVQVCN